MVSIIQIMYIQVAYAPAPPQLVAHVIHGLLREGPDIKDKFRHLEIALINNSGYDLRFVNSEFDSGCYHRQPPPIIRNGQAVAYSICNGEGTIGRGVSMHHTFDIDGSDYYLGIGHSSPLSGSYKTRAGFSRKANIGYRMWNDMDDNCGWEKRGKLEVDYCRDGTTVTIHLFRGSRK